ncbi:MAG: hypothetical protein ACD_71C00159G0002 [uncultured bacterium (gcode 4)]|uniref:Glycosyl transferase family 1 domain-containing protein n=1 Tax=uncultured bacterium (gcode 4) TaxID=1234023 RepID=K1Z514_9BACT|nr:MAG: hypothetical protein ACD_71C00159G0002 [uncultured bacterium (gcode 4)]
MARPDLTIVAPWLCKSDWTSIVFDDLTRLILHQGLSFNSVIGLRIGKKRKALLKEPFAYLGPKLKVIEKIVQCAKNNILADNIIVLDSSFVNMKVLRYVAGKDKTITCFVNGGVFQNHDLDRQSLDQYVNNLLDYEYGHYSLVDRIILPSKYALRIFLDNYPNLKTKSFCNYYSLPSDYFIESSFLSKKGCLFPSRNCFEKGFDVIRELNKQNVKIDLINEFNNNVFRRLLGKYKVVLIPARAELFGFCAIEAILAGSIPIVSRGLSYDELINIPDSLKISLPIGPQTIKEIKAIINTVNCYSQKKYENVVNVARSHLIKVLSDERSSFDSGIKSTMYERK